MSVALVNKEAGADGSRLAQLLVASGLWIEDQAGFRFADGGFCGWDAIAEPVELQEAKRRQQSAAGRASAEARSQKYGSAVPLNARNAPNAFPNGPISTTERKART